MKIKILKTVIANVNGISTPFAAGDEVDIDSDAARMLVRGHYAARMDQDDPPAIKVIREESQPVRKAVKVGKDKK